MCNRSTLLIKYFVSLVFTLRCLNLTQLYTMSLEAILCIYITVYNGRLMLKYQVIYLIFQHQSTIVYPLSIIHYLLHLFLT